MPTNPPVTTFGDLAIGQEFTFLGCRYRKTALAMSEDKDRNGNIFLAETPVEVGDAADPTPRA